MNRIGRWLVLMVASASTSAWAQVSGTCVANCDSGSSSSSDSSYSSPTYYEDPAERARREAEEEAERAERARRYQLAVEQALREAQQVHEEWMRLSKAGVDVRLRAQRFSELEAQLTRREQELGDLEKALAPVPPALMAPAAAAGPAPSLAEYIRKLNREEQERQKAVAAKLKTEPPPPPARSTGAKRPVPPAAFLQEPRISDTSFGKLLPSREEMREQIRKSAEEFAWSQWWKHLEKLPGGERIVFVKDTLSKYGTLSEALNGMANRVVGRIEQASHETIAILGSSDQRTPSEKASAEREQAKDVNETSGKLLQDELGGWFNDQVNSDAAERFYSDE